MILVNGALFFEYYFYLEQMVHYLNESFSHYHLSFLFTFFASITKSRTFILEGQIYEHNPHSTHFSGLKCFSFSGDSKLSIIKTGDNLAGQTLTHLPHLKHSIASCFTLFRLTTIPVKFGELTNSSESIAAPIIGPPAIK